MSKNSEERNVLIDVERQSIHATDQQKEQIQGVAGSEAAHCKLELKKHTSAFPPESS